MKSSSIKKTLPKLAWITIVFLLVLILPVNVLVQMHIRHKSQQESSLETFAQLEQLMELNKKDIERGKEDFSQKAIQSAEMAAYFVSFYPEVMSSLEQSIELAEKLDVDEIHFFTPEGEIFSGTHPQYYGYTFSSGEQMSFFLPMLKNRSLKLCQEITPNTAEGKEMQYAAVWMEDGSGIVQIGMEPRRLLQEIEEKSLTKIITSLPFDLSGHLHVVDKSTGTVVASTNESLIGADMNIEMEKTQGRENANVFHQTYGGQKYCIYAQTYNNYVLVRTYLSKYPLHDTLISTILVFLYIGVSATIVISMIGWYLNKKLVHNLAITVDNLKKIENGNMENVSLKTGITEYDELIFYINQMLHSIRHNWNKLAYIVDKSQFPIGIYEQNSFYKKTFINMRLLEILGLTGEENLPPAELSILVKSRLIEAKNQKVDNNEHIYKYNKNGTATCLRMEIISDEQSTTYYVTDVSLWWSELGQLRDENNLDFLTGLYNRRGFSIMMDKLFSEPEKLKLGMMVVADADNLKKINDLYGHHIGDEYLREIAKRLREASGINSVCTRTGGDEFSIFLYGYSSQQQLEAVLQSLKSKRGKPFAPESAKLKETLEFSLGTALFPADGEDYHALMRLADDKMYLEKQERTRSGHRQEYNGRSMTRSE